MVDVPTLPSVLGNLITTISTNTGTAPFTTKYTYLPNINNTILMNITV